MDVIVISSRLFFKRLADMVVIREGGNIFIAMRYCVTNLNMG